jgi:hypothetical protein
VSSDLQERMGRLADGVAARSTMPPGAVIAARARRRRRTHLVSAASAGVLALGSLATAVVVLGDDHPTVGTYAAGQAPPDRTHSARQVVELNAGPDASVPRDSVLPVRATTGELDLVVYVDTRGKSCAAVVPASPSLEPALTSSCDGNDGAITLSGASASGPEAYGVRYGAAPDGTDRVRLVETDGRSIVVPAYDALEGPDRWIADTGYDWSTAKIEALDADGRVTLSKQVDEPQPAGLG